MTRLRGSPQRVDVAPGPGSFRRGCHVPGCHGHWLGSPGCRGWVGVWSNGVGWSPISRQRAPGDRRSAGREYFDQVAQLGVGVPRVWHGVGHLGADEFAETSP